MLKRKADESERERERAVAAGGLKKTGPTGFCFDGGGSKLRGAGFQFVSLFVTVGKIFQCFGDPWSYIFLLLQLRMTFGLYPLNKDLPFHRNLANDLKKLYVDPSPYPLQVA